MSFKALYKPLQVGKLTMKNRFVVPALTRIRADADHVPTDMMVKYYAQRASFGLIIAEATQVQDGYSTFGFEPGIYGKPQVEGWRKVTKAVHDKGGLIFLQIHHGGRATVACNLDKGLKVFGPSEIGIAGHNQSAAFAIDGKKQPYPEKVHAMTIPEIKEQVQLFTTAAKNAIEAGFDGVEIHGGNAYLIDQFIKETSNTRTDEYGGSIENRCRFLLEITDSVIAAIGPERTAVRIAPLNTYNAAVDSNPEATTKYLCEELGKRNIAFLDVLRADLMSGKLGAAAEWARKYYKGVLFTGGRFKAPEAEKLVEANGVDAVCFGVLSIANPDLPERVQSGAPLNKPDPTTFYARTEVGYTDYPPAPKIE